MSSKSAWSAKRQRQYVHVKKGLVAAGKPAPLAEEVGARAVNHTRAVHDETQAAAEVAAAAPDTAVPSSDPVEEGPSLTQLRHEARLRGIKGRSVMNRAQLEAALQT
jgi:hypothetical protein